jgi:DNA-binding MarR family transcriptional regulator
MFISKHLRPVRQKAFGYGKPQPLDREAKARLMTLARGMMRNRAKGCAYGVVTAKAYAVLGALLYGFHNAAKGLCFPSYEAIAERAGCARSTVGAALKALEGAGLLSWSHRLRRVRERCEGLPGLPAWRWRVLRSSNAYAFNVPQPTKSENGPRTGTQALQSSPVAVVPARAYSESPLELALGRFKRAFQGG